MSKFIVKVGDDTHEVDRDALKVPDGHVLMSQEQFNSTIEGRVAKERKSAEDVEKAVKDRLASDDNFFKSLAEKRGLQLDDGLKPVATLDSEKVRQLQEHWKKEHLEPVMQDLDSFRKEAEEGRRKALHAKITEAARRLKVKDEMLENPFGEGPSHFIRDAAEQFEWDAERKEYFFKRNGNPVYGEDGGYAKPEALLADRRKQDAEFRYFKDDRPGSSGFDAAASGDTKRVSRDTFVKWSPAKQMEFTKANGTVSD